MATIFVSSTYRDLAKHRAAVNDVLIRMRQEHVAMEFFGSRGDEAVPASLTEIERCTILVGIYAWRYGWVPPGSATSITEQEFTFARKRGKTCLCYVASEEHPWPPGLIDHGRDGEALERFKKSVSALVRSEFTTPDNLAKQVAADVARELAPKQAGNTVGALLQVNWDVLHPELQAVFLDAYRRAKDDARDGVVATRHVLAALVSLPNSSSILLQQMDRKLLESVASSSAPPVEMDGTTALAQAFQHERPFSGCVMGSLDRLLPRHSTMERLSALELAADLLKNGRGESVRKFRQANVDANAVNSMMRHAEAISRDPTCIIEAMGSFSDLEIAALSHSTGIPVDPDLRGAHLRQAVLEAASAQKRQSVLAGELMRRKPDLVWCRENEAC